MSPSNGDVCVSLLVSDDRHMGTHKHVSQLSGGVCAVLPVSDHLQYEVRLPGDVLQLDQNNISSYVSGEDRGILVSERVRKHVSPFSGGVCVPLPVSFQFQDGVKGSDDNLSMDQSNISSGSFSKDQSLPISSSFGVDQLLPVWSLSSDFESLDLSRRRLRAALRDQSLLGELVFGSHDPHRIGDVDHAIRARKKPTFSLAAFDEATFEQLKVRPFPRMNEPCRTESLPECVETSAPILFYSIGEVINEKALRLVKAWMASFRKMAAAAKKGNWRLAKVRRPVDLWLSEEDYTMPAAKGLYVDLRPLARGESAVGYPFGSFNPGAVDTDISVDNVALWGKDFADQALIDEARRGMSDDSSVPAGTLLCAPHVGALKSFEVAMSKIDKSVTEGWASNYESLPCWPIRCAAYSVVDETAKTGKAKFRLTNDLSSPEHKDWMSKYSLLVTPQCVWPDVITFARLGRGEARLRLREDRRREYLEWRPSEDLESELVDEGESELSSGGSPPLRPRFLSRSRSRPPPRPLSLTALFSVPRVVVV